MLACTEHIFGALWVDYTRVSQNSWFNVYDEWASHPFVQNTTQRGMAMATRLPTGMAYVPLGKTIALEPHGGIYQLITSALCHNTASDENKKPWPILADGPRGTGTDGEKPIHHHQRLM